MLQCFFKVLPTQTISLHLFAMAYTDLTLDIRAQRGPSFEKDRLCTLRIE